MQILGSIRISGSFESTSTFSLKRNEHHMKLPNMRLSRKRGGEKWVGYNINTTVIHTIFKKFKLFLQVSRRIDLKFLIFSSISRKRRLKKVHFITIKSFLKSFSLKNVWTWIYYQENCFWLFPSPHIWQKKDFKKRLFYKKKFNKFKIFFFIFCTHFFENNFCQSYLMHLFSTQFYSSRIPPSVKFTLISRKLQKHFFSSKLAVLITMIFVMIKLLAKFNRDNFVLIFFVRTIAKEKKNCDRVRFSFFLEQSMVPQIILAIVLVFWWNVIGFIHF